MVWFFLCSRAYLSLHKSVFECWVHWDKSSATCFDLHNPYTERKNLDLALVPCRRSARWERERPSDYRLLCVGETWCVWTWLGVGGSSILQLPHGTVLITVGPNFPCRAGCPEEELAVEIPRVSRGWGFPLRAELKTQSWISTQLESFGPHHETRLTKNVSCTDHLLCSRGFPGDSGVKNPPAMQETWVQSLAQEDPLEEGMATLSSVLGWEIPWTEESGGLPSIGLQRVGHDLATTAMFQTPVKLPVYIIPFSLNPSERLLSLLPFYRWGN